MILVIGSTGNSGSEVVRQLAAAGVKIRALIRNPNKAAGIKTLGVEIVEGDLERPETLDAGVKGIEKVFLVSSPDPRVVTLHGNLIEAAKKAGVRHIVRLSALGASSESPVSLLKWHWEAEKRLESSGIPFTHLRPHFFMQNMLMFAQTIKTEGKFYAPLGENKISMVDIRDIAAVAVKTLTESGHERKTYEITGPEALSFYDVAKKLAAVTGRTITYVDVPPAAARKGMLDMGLPDWLADGLVKLYERFGDERAARVTNVVATVTGATPRTFDQFARDFVPAFVDVVAVK